MGRGKFFSNLCMSGETSTFSKLQDISLHLKRGKGGGVWGFSYYFCVSQSAFSFIARRFALSSSILHHCFCTLSENTDKNVLCEVFHITFVFRNQHFRSLLGILLYPAAYCIIPPKQSILYPAHLYIIVSICSLRVQPWLICIADHVSCMGLDQLYHGWHSIIGIFYCSFWVLIVSYFNISL